MTARRFVVWLARTALVVGSAAWVGVGCSRQGEGERCDWANAGDSDCDDGLTCIRCAALASGQIDRCCPAAGDESVAACQRSDIERECGAAAGGTTGSGGTGGAGGTGGRGGTGGSGAVSGSDGGGLAGEGGAEQ